MLHLRSVLVRVHPINSVSLGFVLTEGFQNILDFPEFFLKENVLLAGRLHLVVKRKDTPGQESGNLSSFEHFMTTVYMSNNRLVWERKGFPRNLQP